MSLRVGVRLDYISTPPKPTLRVAIVLNGEEIWIGGVDWLALVCKTTFFKEVRLTGGPSRQRLRKAATKQERETAEALGGRRQTGSGARRGHKGDGRVFGRFRIEDKFTQAKEFRLKLTELWKARSECAGREVPVFNVQFREPNTLKVLDSWALVPWSEWEKRANAEAGDDQ